jgi:ABC-type glutathione transport system ATPase component
MIPILELRDLKVMYRTGAFQAGREIRAVDGVNLKVQPGESLGLIGESGSGKTTLARCALLLQKPSSGSVCFDGCDLLNLSRNELRARRREFQMIFQDPFASLDPRMTVHEILAEPFEVQHLTLGRDKAAVLLAEVSMDPGMLNKMPDELSGGQRQRVAIARALALKPRLLIADEPVSSLDASVQAQILNLLADLRRRFGLTLILISHSIEAIHYLCTRIAVMQHGRITEFREIH